VVQREARVEVEVEVRSGVSTEGMAEVSAMRPAQARPEVD
jgi:hypothetical protein